ncbi:ATP-binding protein [Aeromonas veronii]|uniref:ATP-binding protein n=1 Tax=Aeromonas veronii TaxID=654 RepID=UPI003B9EAC54
MELLLTGNQYSEFWDKNDYEIERDMIISYLSGFKKFGFINEEHVLDDTKSVYTVIVGKNGTGKSRLLKNIISELLREVNKVNDKDLFLRDVTTRIDSDSRGYIDMKFVPHKIIAISTSPFDKFPLPRGNITVDGYSYLGLRGLPSSNLGLSYMSKIINSLMESILIDPKKCHCITIVLDYLGYSDSIVSRFHMYPSVRKMEEILYSDEPEKELYNFIVNSPMSSVNVSFFLEGQNRFSSEKINEALRCFERVIHSTRKPRFDVEISRNGIRVIDSTYYIDSDFLFLIQSGFARLRDVTLEKREHSRRLRISDASSGEQSVVMSFLGIASQIEDGSLVCIDEPEVCLHPEWQEKYIELLMYVFEQYKDCQFLIATHSPQVISNLRAKNCYIMSMDDGEAKSADSFVNRSADYQLAKVFKTPGFKNEYLNRIALNIFSKVSRRKTFDDVDLENFSFLVDCHDHIDREDPLYDLIIALKEMHNRYG